MRNLIERRFESLTINTKSECAVINSFFDKFKKKPFWLKFEKINFKIIKKYNFVAILRIVASKKEKRSFKCAVINWIIWEISIIEGSNPN